MTWEQIYHFVIVYSISLFSIVVTRDTIFVTDIIADKIRKAPIESLQFEDIPLQYVETPVAVDYDPVDSKLYWADEHFKAIIRANLDGTQEEVVVPYLNVPKGLSIDVQNRHLYWTDTGTDTIERANLDGSDRVVITSENHDEPRAIVVDSQGGWIYWTDWGVNNSKIERANLDGSSRTILVDTGLQLPYGLAVDLEGSRIYWCDADLNKIDTTDLNGQNRVNLGTFKPENSDGIDIHPFDIGIYNDYIYWTDFALKKIIQMNKFVGRQAELVGPAIFERAAGLHIFKDEVNECSSNPCNGGECIDEINFYTCNCTSTGFEGEHCEITTPDLIAPVVTCPANQQALGFNGATVNYPAVTATDNSGGVVQLAYSKLSGSLFNLGVTIVTVTATDPSGNQAFCQFSVTVTVDTIAPLIKCPANQQGSGPNGATVNYPVATATDNSGGIVHITYSPLSGSFFNLGVTTVTLTATDPSGNQATCQFTVTVTGTTPGDIIAPFVSCPANQQASGLNGATVNYPVATATDNSGGIVQLAYIPRSGSFFNLGVTIVTVTATDLSGNLATCQFTVTVTGDTPITETTFKPPNSDNSPICIHPGDIDNGHVINDNHADPLVPGTRLKFLCADDYDLVGANIVFCQTDGTWSDKAPSCIAEPKETELSPSVVYGGGAGGVLVILILIVILIAVCCKKRNNNRHSNVVVHYSANGSRAPEDPKDMAEYSPSVIDTMHYNTEPTLKAGFDRPPMATPRGTKSNHVYDDVNFGAQGAVGGVGIYPPEYPPSYGSVVEEGEINNGYLTLKKDAESEVKSEYLYMKTNEVKTPIYDVPKPSNDEK